MLNERDYMKRSRVIDLNHLPNDDEALSNYNAVHLKTYNPNERTCNHCKHVGIPNVTYYETQETDWGIIILAILFCWLIFPILILIFNSGKVIKHTVYECSRCGSRDFVAYKPVWGNGFDSLFIKQQPIKRVLTPPPIPHFARISNPSIFSKFWNSKYWN